MDPRTWPLSVAATRRLLDLRTDRPRRSSESLLVTLSAKELVLRGAIRTEEVVRKRRSTSMLVSTRRPEHALPAAPAALLSRVGTANRRDLASLLRETGRKHSRLRSEISTAARGELEARGLITQRFRRVLGIFPQRFDVLTPSGEAWQRAAADIVERGRLLSLRSDDGPVPPAEVDALGPLLVLVPGGLSMGARASAQARAGAAATGLAAASGAALVGLQALPSDEPDATSGDDPDREPTSDLRRRAASAQTVGGTPIVVPPGNPEGTEGPPLDRYDEGTEPFSNLDSLGDSLSGLLDDALSALGSGLDSAFDSLDSAFDAIDSAMDSIDSAVDAGFSDGGGGDGGGDGGGGGGGD